MLSVQAGDLYRVQDSYIDDEVPRAGELHVVDLHLVTRSNGHIINTLCGGALHTWYADDFFSCAERVEVGS